MADTPDLRSPIREEFSPPTQAARPDTTVLAPAPEQSVQNTVPPGRPLPIPAATPASPREPETFQEKLEERGSGGALMSPSLSSGIFPRGDYLGEREVGMDRGSAPASRSLGAVRNNNKGVERSDSSNSSSSVVANMRAKYAHTVRLHLTPYFVSSN